MTDKTKGEFQLVFDQLKEIMSKYASGQMQIRSGIQGQYELIGPPTSQSKGREVWFGAVRIGKRYVSYHLMAIYACPDLLNHVSPELKQRMQGKSCFNFTRVDERLFKELAELTEQGYQRFLGKGLINAG